MVIGSILARAAGGVEGISEKGLPPQMLPNPPVRLGYVCCDGLAKGHADGTYERFSDSKVGGDGFAGFGSTDGETGLGSGSDGAGFDRTRLGWGSVDIAGGS
ncbi:succinate dehydrogenase flavoprotein subunit [Striga asiatica]|uniref:Succinate dehydrogenase flavoprotein subunit n=1 Tax=Striga asiatica TaxID=4170 RepID=A0A5A7Q5G4_STRAF|nr:succinate dehydrogenase flavoprotein subunit [Striga asiatica]